jgi:cysteinyl-tRNA synthetase
VSGVPEDVRALVTEREAARAARDFARADALRSAIAERGYRVLDGPGGSTVETIPASAAPTRLRPDDVGSLLDEPATAEVSVHWLVEGWAEDVLRALAAFRAHQGDRTVQYVVADLTEADPAGYGEAEVVPLQGGAGWGAARNAGLRRSRGRIVVLVDGSVEPTGDVLGPIADVLADDAVGVCGPFGIATEDLRRFHESSGVGPHREVDAIEGYLMAFRRDVLRHVGMFDERFRWYRTADIELSFRIKDAGMRAVVIDLPVRRHEHRMWHATPPEERDRLSKRNFYRFLERFRDRFDLLAAGPGRAGGGR